MRKLPKNDLQAIRDFKMQLNISLKADSPKLILFGSKARGDFRNDSDLDVLVILKKSTLGKKNYISGLATDLFLKYQTDFSPHIYSEKEFKKLSDLQTPFTQMVKKEGVKL